jgi:hypothetical protein
MHSEETTSNDLPTFQTAIELRDARFSMVAGGALTVSDIVLGLGWSHLVWVGAIPLAVWTVLGATRFAKVMQVAQPRKTADQS